MNSVLLRDITYKVTKYEQSVFTTEIIFCMNSSSLSIKSGYNVMI